MDILKWAVTVLTMLGLGYHFIEFFCQVCWFSRPFVRKTIIVHIRANVFRNLFNCDHFSLATFLKKWRLTDLFVDIFRGVHVRDFKLSTCGLLNGTFDIWWEVNLVIWLEMWAAEKMTFDMFIQITLLSEC